MLRGLVWLFFGLFFLFGETDKTWRPKDIPRIIFSKCQKVSDLNILLTA